MPPCTVTALWKRSRREIGNGGVGVDSVGREARIPDYGPCTAPRLMSITARNHIAPRTHTSNPSNPVKSNPVKLPPALQLLDADATSANSFFVDVDSTGRLLGLYSANTRIGERAGKCGNELGSLGLILGARLWKTENGKLGREPLPLLPSPTRV